MKATDREKTRIIGRLARLAIKLLSDRLKDFGISDRVVIQIGDRIFKADKRSK